MSRLRRSFDLTLPASRIGLIRSGIVIFAVSIAHFGNAVVVGSDYQMPATEICSQSVGQMNLDMGAVAGIVLLPTLLAISIRRITSHRQIGGTSAGTVPVMPDPVAAATCLGLAVCTAAEIIVPVVGTIAYASFIQLWPHRMKVTLSNCHITMAGGYRSLRFTRLISLEPAMTGHRCSSCCRGRSAD